MDLSCKNYLSSTPQGSLSGSKLAMNYSSGNRQGRSSPTYESSPNYRGSNDAFPYGLSGVAMPNYGYPGELYQFASNGYPRKSRTCSYCGKVFTRSTTRRYHEKRCPLLRAAVCSLIPEERNLQGTQTSRNGQQGQSSIPSSVLSRNSLENTPKSGMDKLSNQSVVTSQSNSLTTSSQRITPPSPYLDSSRVDDSTSSIIKHETSLTDTSASTAQNQGHDLTPPRLTPDSQGSPHDHKSIDARSFSLSPFQMPAGLDLTQSPSNISRGAKDDGNSLIQEESSKADFKDENGNGLDLGVQDSEMFPEDMEEERGEHDLNFTSSVRPDTSFMDIANTIPTSMSLSQVNMADTGNNSDNETDASMALKSNGVSESTVSKCGVCGKNFESRWQLHVHEQIHKKFKPYACRFCGQRFSKAALRITHERDHFGDNNYVCAVCGSSFNHTYSLRIHMKQHHQEGPWLCRHCGKAMLTQTELCEHLETHDLPDNEKQSLQFMTSSPVGPLSEGESSNGDGEINESELLSDSIDSPGQESPAENLVIKEENNSQETELCTICGRDIPKTHMPYHLKAHEGQKPYECPICGKRFGYKNNMKSHIKLHAGIKPYQCNVCGAKFTRGSTLRRHARRHGISAESVWDLFVRNGNTASQNTESGQNRESNTPSNLLSSGMMASTPSILSSKVKSDPDIAAASLSESSYVSSMYDTPTSVAMSNALLMGYQNHQQTAGLVGLPYLFSPLPPTNSEVPPQSAGFNVSSSQSPLQPQQPDQALNLSVQKPVDSDQFNHLTGSLSPVSERPRSRSYSGSDITRRMMVSVPSLTANCKDVGIQTKTCCKAGIESMYGIRSPSEASIQSGDSGATYQNVSNSGIDNSTESMASLLSSGRMFKCDHCESYFSEYAMYRIHAKLHVRGGRTMPYLCPVCAEDCHDRVYFALHVSEHLR